MKFTVFVLLASALVALGTLFFYGVLRIVTQAIES